MGYLHYGDAQRFHFDDRALTHLRTIIFAKLALRESFVFTWISGGAQHSIWVHAALPLHFEFEQEVAPELNPEWVEQLSELANSPAGLRLLPEPKTTK